MVHKQGLWHKSAQVFVFNGQDELLVQKRAAHKDLYANQWDYSVGEHVQPNESFVAGALRGLKEELNIELEVADLQPLGEERWVTFKGMDRVDREIQQAFSCRWDGAVRWDVNEVQFVHFIQLDHLNQWINMAPAEFTPWFADNLVEFGWR